VSVKALDRPEVKAFIDFYLAQGRALSRRGRLRARSGRPRLPARPGASRPPARPGSLFEQAGSQVGLTIEELLRREEPVTGHVTPAAASAPIEVGPAVPVRARIGPVDSPRRASSRALRWSPSRSSARSRSREFFTDTEWTPLFATNTSASGRWCSGTRASVIAIAVALPLGLLRAIYLSEFAPARAPRLKPVLELLAGVPTVVYGYFALTFVTPLLQQFIPGI
jgi:hypothetical protein